MFTLQRPLEVGDEGTLREVSTRNPRSVAARVVKVARKYATVEMDAWPNVLRVDKTTGRDHTRYGYGYHWQFERPEDIERRAKLVAARSELKAAGFLSSVGPSPDDDSTLFMAACLRQHQAAIKAGDPF